MPYSLVRWRLHNTRPWSPDMAEDPTTVSTSYAKCIPYLDMLTQYHHLPSRPICVKRPTISDNESRRHRGTQLRLASPWGERDPYDVYNDNRPARRCCPPPRMSVLMDPVSARAAVGLAGGDCRALSKFFYCNRHRAPATPTSSLSTVSQDLLPCSHLLGPPRRSF